MHLHSAPVLWAEGRLLSTPLRSSFSAPDLALPPRAHHPFPGHTWANLTLSEAAPCPTSSPPCSPLAQETTRVLSTCSLTHRSPDGGLQSTGGGGPWTRGTA